MANWFQEVSTLLVFSRQSDAGTIGDARFSDGATGILWLVVSLLTWLISLQNVVWLVHLLQYALNEAFAFIGVSAYLSRMADATDLYTKNIATTDWLFEYTRD